MCGGGSSNNNLRTSPVAAAAAEHTSTRTWYVGAGSSDIGEGDRVCSSHSPSTVCMGWEERLSPPSSLLLRARHAHPSSSPPLLLPHIRTSRGIRSSRALFGSATPPPPPVGTRTGKGVNSPARNSLLPLPHPPLPFPGHFCPGHM